MWRLRNTEERKWNDLERRPVVPGTQVSLWRFFSGSWREGEGTLACRPVVSEHTEGLLPGVATESLLQCLEKCRRAWKRPDQRMEALATVKSNLRADAAAAAAAAGSLQSCLTLCDPIDSLPPGSPVPGILQARTLEWVAISSSNAWKWKVKVKSLSRVRLIATPWTVACQAPPNIFSPQKFFKN